MKTSKWGWLKKAIVGFVIVALAIALFPFTNLQPTTKADDDDPPAQTITAPPHDKQLTSHGDGTYQLELSVTGDAQTNIVPDAHVNVMVIFDVSSSMYTYNAAHVTGGYGYYATSSNGTPGYNPLYKKNDNGTYTQLNNDTYEGTVYKKVGSNYIEY